MEVAFETNFIIKTDSSHNDFLSSPIYKLVYNLKIEWEYSVDISSTKKKFL